VDFLVRRDDLRQCRFEPAPVPEPGPGEAVLEVESFGLTSNNVTYAVMGDAMSYWRFFPAEDGWGRIPVWGFAHVTASTRDELAEGTRVYGYLPASSHLVVTPDHVEDGGFVDATAHRTELAAVYNAYSRASDEPRPGDDAQILFRPLFGTSFLIDDYLDERDFFGADTVLISSASSKTAIGTAFVLRRREGIEVVGLTSPGRADFVEGLGVYDRVVAYDDVEALPAGAAVYVDISGDAGVRAAVHHHLADSLAHDCLVGASHWERIAGDSEPLPGPAPEMFFAPGRFAKRTADWGSARLEGHVRDAFAEFDQWLATWLDVVHGSGPEDVERSYHELLEGRTPPERGYVMSLPA
jgi:hypothetical protein